jgi:hypothetical protein
MSFQVTLKPLSGAAFTVEATAADSVASLREKVFSARPELAGCTVTLIYQGKVLADAASLGDAGVSEKGFVVRPRALSRSRSPTLSWPHTSRARRCACRRSRVRCLL